MRDRKESLTLAGMVAMFTVGGNGKILKCTIDRFCRTQIFELSGAVFDGDCSPRAHVIYEKGNFRATIVDDPQMFLSGSEFSPHYTVSYSLRKEIEEVQSKTGKTDRDNCARLFVILEEYKKITPTDMHQGECIVVDQRVLKGGTEGQEAILALRSADGAWPDESADIIFENIVLAAFKVEQNITYGVKPLLDRVNFLERNGRVVHIQEGYLNLAFGALRVVRKLDDGGLRDKADRIRRAIDVLCGTMRKSSMSELITALRLQDTANKKYLCLWYLQLWETACNAGGQIGERQFGNPEGKSDQERRREQGEHRNDIAHGKTEEIDYKIFDGLQKDVLKLLRENVLEVN